jgi:hypothetical protein
LPQMNLVMAKTYLSAQDPKLVTRTWTDVMTRFCDRSNANTRMRHERVVRTKPMQFLKTKRLIETTADDLLEVLKLGSNSTIMFLQTLHNDALGMGWISTKRITGRTQGRVNLHNDAFFERVVVCCFRILGLSPPQTRRFYFEKYVR